MLLEDRDSSYSPKKKNPIQKYKDKHGLKHYFNISNSPNHNIIENC